MCLRPTEHKDDQASVELSQDISKDSVNKEDQSAYWYHRYSLRPLLDAQGHVSLTPTGAAVHDVPLMLAEAQDSILMTGKYLNAIRECGRQVVRPLPFDVHIGEALLLTSCHSCSAPVVLLLDHQGYQGLSPLLSPDAYKRTQGDHCCCSQRRDSCIQE